ncbi:MAG: MFS transporter [Rubrivivax sp.]|nr:MAG: MFS transporter [Rubrivivax sp.]
MTSSSAAPSSAPPGPAARGPWVVLMALCLGFTLSQAFRTVAAMMAPPLQAGLGLSPAELGVFAATFHFAFGAMQVFMGIGMDLLGVRRTVLLAFPLAVMGSVLCAMAPSFAWLVAGQALIGVGCAPAFLACTVFIARAFPSARFAAVSGAVMGLSGFLQLVLMPRTLGIALLASITYASFIALRGLWLGPMLTQQYGLSLVQSGNVALVVSLTSMVGPLLFGRVSAVGLGRRRWIMGFTLGMAALFLLLALLHSVVATVVIAIAIGFGCGYIVLQYADVRASYPDALTGRALAVFTMAMFLGVAVMQWVTGLAASAATAHGIDPYKVVNLTVTALLLVGTAGFAWLPRAVEER